jgi:SAM-dependent methyltransferase
MATISEEIFTPRGINPDCPDTQFWTAEDRESSEVEVAELVAGFVRAIQPELVLETGCWRGLTTFAIAQALAKNGHGRLVSIDRDGAVAAVARDRCAVFQNLEVLICDSLSYMPDAPVQLAWLDSSLGIREAEFRRYYPFLSGIVGFHDTGRHHAIVREQVERLAHEGLLRPIFLNTPRGCAFCEVLAQHCSRT